MIQFVSCKEKVAKSIKLRRSQAPLLMGAAAAGSPVGCPVSRAEGLGLGSRVEGQGSRVEGSMVKDQGSKARG
eukprot:189888-Rhodomonas_salina.2